MHHAKSRSRKGVLKSEQNERQGHSLDLQHSGGLGYFHHHREHRGECGYEEHKPKLCVLCELCGKIFGDPRCTERNGTTKRQPSCHFEFLSREIYLNCFPFALFASWRETSYPSFFRGVATRRAEFQIEPRTLDPFSSCPS